MMVLVTYDVNTETAAGRKRLRHVAKLCVDYGQRVQHSVFECSVEIKSKLLTMIDQESDSIRFYLLGKNWQNRVETIGRDDSYDPDMGILLL